MAGPVLIVGAGHAGVQTAARLAERGWDGGIVLLDKEDAVPYERPPLSKELLKVDSAGEPSPLRRESYYRGKGIERLHGEVVRIHRQARMVELADGIRLPYGKLVLATGSTPRQPAVPGARLPGVHLLKTLDDARLLNGALVRGARVVVVGAGYIGLEVAAAAAGRHCAVTVLEYQDRVLSRVTCDVVARFFEQLHRGHGTDFAFGAAVTAFEGEHRVERVTTADGAVYAADVVVAGIGVAPAEGLARDAGIVCADGVIVDGRCRTSDPDVYAVGDVSRWVLPDENVDRRLESVQNAVAQGLTAANDIVAGEETRREVPWFWTVQHGVRLQTAGVRLPGDDVVVRGDARQGVFSVLYLRDGRLAAIDTIGSLKDFVPGKKLIAAGALLDPAAAADPAVKLAAAQCETTSPS